MEIFFPMLQDFFSFDTFGIGVLDIIIVTVVLFYAYEGKALGFVTAFSDLLSFICSFILALKLYTFVALGLSAVTALPLGFAHALGFFLTALFSEVILSITFRKLTHRLPSLSPGRFSNSLKSADKHLGIIPGVISAFIILSFLFTVIVSLPSSPVLKKAVTDSKIGSKLITHTTTFEQTLNEIFGGALTDTLNFLTIEPQSNETVDLNYQVQSPTVDQEAEEQMLEMVNKERAKRGLTLLVIDEELVQFARSYSLDMFQRGYFSHYNPEGESPFDRMEKAGITYTSAGENLALAPSVELSMQGLMNSPGHRVNILRPEFGKVGIGVMDGGIYGKMFTQEFTD
ncbi:MAG TPA: CvpA family protein [Patescibacteria group bacterium]|nr:CvpA family protein [Patescibacteria group bacterium]